MPSDVLKANIKLSRCYFSDYRAPSSNERLGRKRSSVDLGVHYPGDLLIHQRRKKQLIKRVTIADFANTKAYQASTASLISEQGKSLPQILSTGLSADKSQPGALFPESTAHHLWLFSSSVYPLWETLGPGLRSVSKQFANVPQRSCTRDRKFCKTFANVSILNAAVNFASPPKCTEGVRGLLSTQSGPMCFGAKVIKRGMTLTWLVYSSVGDLTDYIFMRKWKVNTQHPRQNMHSRRLRR